MPKRKCLYCKEVFEKKRSNQSVCTPACAYEYAKAKTKKKKAEEWKVEKKEMKQNLKKWMDYYQETLKVFNTYIRTRDKDQPCISCDAPAGTYRLTSGHYFPQGSNKSVALDEDNAHSQCWNNCNRNKSGNLSEYLPRLIDKIGQERFDALELKKNTIKKYSIEELKGLKVFYKLKIKNITQ